MDKSSIEKVNTRVYRQFPDLKGKRPNVSSYAENKFLILYKSNAKTANGKTINRTVRVVADEKGKIVKITSSR